MRMVEERARGTAQAQGAQAQTNARLLGLDAGQQQTLLDALPESR